MVTMRPVFPSTTAITPLRHPMNTRSCLRSMSMLLGCPQGARGQVFNIFRAWESDPEQRVAILHIQEDVRPASSEAKCSVLPPRLSIAPATLPVSASIAVRRWLPRSAVKIQRVLRS